METREKVARAIIDAEMKQQGMPPAPIGYDFRAEAAWNDYLQLADAALAALPDHAEQARREWQPAPPRATAAQEPGA